MIDPNDVYLRELAGRAVAAFERYVAAFEREVTVNERREERMQKLEGLKRRRAKAELEGDEP